MTPRRQAVRPPNTDRMQDVRKVLWMWRKSHNAQRGQVWDPRQGKYVWPAQVRPASPPPPPRPVAEMTAFGRIVTADRRAWE